MFIILFFLTIGLLTALVSSLYRKNWSKNFSITIEFDKKGIFEGDKAEIKQVFTNKKLMPVWWGNLKFQVPGELKFEDSMLVDHDHFRKDAVSVWPYERIKRSLPFTAQRRGYYTVKDSDFLTFDMFFNRKFIQKYPQFSEIYVYPDIKQIENFTVDFKKIVGEIIKKRHFIEDPFQFRGVRDYYPFDSLKTVNWNATARAGEMKVNQYHYTTSQEVMLLLDFDSYDWENRSVKEDVIRIAAYLSEKLLGCGISVGLISNASSVTGEDISLPCRNGKNQSTLLLQTMAKINTEKRNRTFDDYLSDILVKKDSRYQYILISHYGEESLQHKLDEIRFNGLSLQWILLKEKSRKITVRNSRDTYVCEVNG